MRDDLADFQNDDVQILAISTDHPYALKAWSESQGFDFPLLSDFWPHGEVAKAYGVFFEKRGMAVRGTFLVDKAGIVRFAEVNGAGRGARPERLAQGGGGPGCLRYPGPRPGHGRVAQRESTRLTPERSQVRTLPRPPA